MYNHKHNRLQEYKTRATILLKDFNRTDALCATKAAKRFLQLPFLLHSQADAILNDRSFFRLKHAQQVIAIENGYNHWNTFRHNIIVEDCLFQMHSAGFLNTWFNNYAEANTYHQQHGGYLLQFRKDFIVCSEEYIHAIGLSVFHKEWKAMGYNWVAPACKKSWQTVFTYLKQQYLAPRKPTPSPPSKTNTNRPQWLNDHINK